MNQELFVDILRSTLLPSINTLFPDGHRLMMDNDPKHTSRCTGAWLEANEVNWWRTPPESPGLDYIENLWHELKEYIRQRSQAKGETGAH